MLYTIVWTHLSVDNLRPRQMCARSFSSSQSTSPVLASVRKQSKHTGNAPHRLYEFGVYDLVYMANHLTNHKSGLMNIKEQARAVNAATADSAAADVDDEQRERACASTLTLISNCVCVRASVCAQLVRSQTLYRPPCVCA